MCTPEMSHPIPDTPSLSSSPNTMCPGRMMIMAMAVATAAAAAGSETVRFTRDQLERLPKESLVEILLSHQVATVGVKADATMTTPETTSLPPLSGSRPNILIMFGAAAVAWMFLPCAVWSFTTAACVA